LGKPEKSGDDYANFYNYIGKFRKVKRFSRNYSFIPKTIALFTMEKKLESFEKSLGTQASSLPRAGKMSAFPGTLQSS